MKQQKLCISHFGHYEMKVKISYQDANEKEVLLTQVNDMNPVAELFLACACLSLKPTREASNKLSIYFISFFSISYDVQ